MIKSDNKARKEILLNQLQELIFSSAKTERLQREFEGNLCGFLKLDDLPPTIDTYIDVRQGIGNYIIDLKTLDRIIKEIKNNS